MHTCNVAVPFRLPEFFCEPQLLKIQFKNESFLCNSLKDLLLAHAKLNFGCIDN